MAKASASKLAARGVKETAGRFRGRAKLTETVPGPVGKPRVEAVMRAAEKAGLLKEKSGRIGVRVSPALIEQAKRQTGIETDTDLIAFALATVALEDNFADAFKKSRGKLDPELKLGF